MSDQTKVAVITGGASGIGLAHAIDLDRKGYKVAILDIDTVALQKAVKTTPSIHPFPCDITDYEELSHIIDEIETNVGFITRLITCAAIMPGGELMGTEHSTVLRTMTINYFGTVNSCQAVIPKMVQRNMGEVLIYGSTAGIVALRKFGTYGASKAATNFYAKVLIKELKKRNLKILLVCPAAVDTPLINQAKDSGPGSLKNIQQTRRHFSTAEKIVRSVENRIRKGSGVYFPGPALWVKFLYPFIPTLIERITEKE
jgi:short-subunit dehydrogenase